MSNSIQILGPRGNTLSVDAKGAGESVFLLHGFPLDQRMWEHQLTGLATRYHVVAVHLRGFGRSTLDEQGFTLAELAQDVEFLRIHLAGDKPIFLVGLSMGGYVAFEYWRQFSAHLRGLILSNTKPTADSEEARAARLKMAQQAMQAGTWEAVKPMFEKLLDKHSVDRHPELAELVALMMREVAPATVSASLHAMAERRDFSELLPSIRVPTLVIAGQADPIAPAAESEAWASQIPNSKFVVLADSGHLSPLEAPLTFNQAVLDFMVKNSL